MIGDPALIAPDDRVHVLERRAAALLAMVAIEPGLTRQRAAAWLWPESDPAQARQALRQQLARLKRLADGVLAGDAALRLGEGVGTDLASDDVGDLLGSFDYRDCETLGHWVEGQRAERRARARSTLSEAALAAEAHDDLDAALAAARRLYAVDEADEPALRLLMRLLYLNGDGAGALRVYDRFVQRLAPDRRGALAPETRALWATVCGGSEASPSPAPVAAAARRAPPASLLRPPRLVGRDRELARLAQSIDEGLVTWVVGEAGLGKSRLLEAAAAAAPGSVVVSSRPGDTGTPYASLARWLRTLTQKNPGADTGWPRGELAPLLPEYGLPPKTALAGLDGGSVAVLPSAVATVWRLAVEQGVQLLLVDDLQFADTASVEMLQSLLADAPSSSPAFVLASRPSDQGAAAALQSALEEAGRIDRLPLGPLDRAGLAALVDSLGLPEIDGERLAPALLRHTGGNPMFVLETLKSMWLRGGRGGELPMPAPVTALIERRLRQLSEAALGLARMAAVAQVDFTIELAEQVLELKALALADAWRELEQAQVLRGGGFAHDLVLEATLASIPAPILRHTHAAVARHLEASGGDAARVARHWLDGGQPVRALSALHAAAGAAAKAMRPREQAQFLEQAAAIEREAGRADAAFGSLRDAVAARFLADRSGLDDATLDRLAAAAPTPAQQADAMRLRCEVLTARGEYEQVIEVAEQALQLAGEDQVLRCELLQTQGGALSLSGQFRRAVDVMRQAEAWLEREGSVEQRVALHGDLAVALDNADRYGEAQTEHRRALDLALANGEHANAVIVLANLAVSLSHTGQLEQATDALMRGERLAAAHDDARGSAATIPSMLSRCLRDQSRFSEALRWAEVGLHEMQTQAPAWVGAMRIHLANLYLLLGQTARAWRELDQVGAEDKLPAWQISALWLAQSRLKAMLGQPHRDLLDKALAAAPTQGRRPLRAALTLAHAQGLAADRALRVAVDVGAEAEALGMQGVRLSALIRATQFATAAGDHRVALAHAGAAWALAETIHPDEMYRGELWLQVARAHAGAGDAEAAAEWQARGAQWVRDTAEHQVPESFRDSFLQRHPVNVALLGHGTRSLFVAQTPNGGAH